MSNYLEAQKKLIEEKKREVLARNSSGRNTEKRIDKGLQAPVSTNADGPKPSLFVNDGNFLARFQAMQNQKSGQVEDEKSSSGKVTLKLNTKRKEQPRILASSSIASSAFEKPPEVSAVEDNSTGKGPERAAVSTLSPSQAAYHQMNNSDLRETSQSSILGKRKRKNRWDEKSEEESMKSSPGVATAPVSTLSVSAQASSSAASSAPSGPLDIIAEFQRAKALVQQRAAEAKSGLLSQDKERQRQLEEQREMEAMYRRIIEEQANQVQKRSSSKDRKPKYQYDSDEDTEEGTWEHKKRMEEMEKTRLKAKKLTEQAQGKHHMADFLPKEELARFQEKVKAIKEGRKADLSDYAEHKIKEDNIGFKMLQKAGWQEGKGLGSAGKGITEPINKGQTSLDNSGVGVEKPHEVEKSDDEFDIYRKRMMLAYKFRPNPLNNPRRPYY